MDAAASKLAALGLPKLNTYSHSKGGRGGSRPGQPSLRGGGGGGGFGAGGRGGFGARPRSASDGAPGGKPQRRRTIERKLARSKGTNRMVDAASGAMMGRAAALLGAKAKLKVKLASEGGAAVAPLTPEEIAAVSAPKKKKQKLAAPAVKKAQLLPSAPGAGSAASEPLPDFLRALGMGAGARDANGEAAWDLDEEMRYFEQQLGIRREKKKKKAAKAAADKAARANDPRASAADDDGNDSDDAELDVNALSRFRKELDEDGLGDLFDFCDLLESGKDTGARDEAENEGFDLNDPDNQDDEPEIAAAAAAAPKTAAATSAASSKASKSSKAAATAKSSSSEYSAARKAEILAREAAIDAKQDAMERALEKAMAKQAARDAKIKAARAAGLPIPAEEPDSDDDDDEEEEAEQDMVDERSGEDDEEEDDDMTAAAIAHAAAVSRKRRRGEEEEDDEEEAEDDGAEEDEDQAEDDDEELEDAEEDDEAEEGAEDEEEAASDAEAPSAAAAESAAAPGKKQPSIADLYGFTAPVPDSLLAFRRGDKNILAASAAGAAAGAGASTAAAGSVGATAAPAAPAKYVPPHLRAQLAAAAAAVAPAASPAAAAAAAVSQSSTSSAAAMLALRRQLKGLLNRLTSANLEHIALQMTSTLYASHPKREVTELLCDELLGLCTLESEGTSGGYALGSNSSTLLASAALVVYLHCTLGSDIGAHFLERFVLAFVSFSAATARAAEQGTAPSAHAIKACTTLVTFLTYLYNFSLIGSGLIYDLLRQFLSDFRPDSIESVLVLLQNCGYQLRREEPQVLKEIVLLIQERAKKYNQSQSKAGKTAAAAAAATSAASSSSAAAASAIPSSFEIPEGRVSFMLDMIYDLKNNKKRHSALYDSILPLQSWLSGKLKRKATAKGSSSSALGESQLRFGMQDIINIPTRGRWWLVGAAWKGKRMGEEDPEKSGSGSASSGAAAAAAAGSKPAAKPIVLPAEDASESVDLLSLARSQHMHTELRKSLFLVLMSSCDYMDCYEKLSKLNLPPAQLRQVVKVLWDCCAQEATWNPYYALVLLQLSRMDGGKEIKFTAQLTLWDAVKDWSDAAQAAAMKQAGVRGEVMKANWTKAKQRQVLHAAKMVSLLLREPAGGSSSTGGGGGGLPLAALKCFDFHALSGLQLLFLTVCLKDFMALSDASHIVSSCLRLHTALTDPKAAGTTRASDARLLRDGIDFFLQHHLTPTAQALKDRAASKAMLQRIASARKALVGDADAEWMFKK